MVSLANCRPFPEEVEVMELFKRALDALSAAVGVVVLMGFVAYERIVREDRGVTCSLRTAVRDCLAHNRCSRF